VGIWAVVFWENPVIKKTAGTSIMRRVFRPRRRVESQVTIWDLCRSSPDWGETEGPHRTLLPTRLYPTLRWFGVPPLSYVSARNWRAGCEQID
jgi:hypothetical protein